MAGITAAIEAEAGNSFARDSAIHRAGLNNKIVIRPKEAIGHQGFGPGTNRVPLQIACHHPKFSRHYLLGRMQPADQGAVGSHHGQARHGVGVGAFPGHPGEKLQQFRHHGDASQAEGPTQDRNVGIQPLAGQQGAPGRTGDPQRAIDADAPCLHQLDQLLEVIALRLPALLAKQLFAGIIQLGQGS